MLEVAIGLSPFVIATAWASGPATEHLRVNSFSRSGQYEAAIAPFGDGGLATVWTSRRQQGGTPGIYMQRLDCLGVALGGEMQVNLWTESAQTSPAIASLPDRGAIVVWTSYGQDGDRGAIVARRFDAMGKGGDELLVNATTDGDQSEPVVAADASGRAYVAWTSDGTSLLVREIEPSGSLGVEHRVATGQGIRAPSIAALADGGAIVVWTEDTVLGGSDVRRTLLAGGSRETSETETLAYDAYEASAASAMGAVIVTWAKADQAAIGCGHTLWCAVLDEQGCVAGPPLGLGGGLAASPLVVTKAGGGPGFAVAMTVPDREDPSQRRVALATLSADGSAVASTSRLTEDLPGEQSMRQATGATRIAALGASGLAIAWDGDADLGDPNAVQVTLTTVAPLERPAGVLAGIDPQQPRVADSGLEQGASPHIPPTFDPRGADRGARTFEWSDLGLGFDAILDTGWTPPDCHMAVGPDHIVTMTNGRISMFTKSGTQIFTDEIEGAGGFWGSLGASGFVFDPECLYDPIHGRYWAMASDAAGSKSYALIAVSDDDDPAGTWFKYRLETTAIAGSVFDSPNISIDDQAVYVTGDGNAGNYQVFIWDVASMLTGAAPAISKSFVITTGIESAGMPSVMDPAAPALYLLEHRESGSNTKVKFYAIRDPLTTPTLTSTEVTVPTFGPPEDPPQKGTTVKVDTFDARFWSVDYKNGSFWATHHVNASRVLARWYEFSMNGWPTSGSSPTLKQSGNIDLGGTIRTYFSAIEADQQGNAMVTFARSSPDEYISMGTAFRAPTDPPGTMRTPTIVKVNTGPYTEALRWGDYAAVRRDPAAPPTAPVFWANHEYAVSASVWRSWVQAITLPGPTPDLNGDGAVNAADLAILIGNWGTASLGDLNVDGVVDAADLSILLGAWS